MAVYNSATNNQPVAGEICVINGAVKVYNGTSFESIAPTNIMSNESEAKYITLFDIQFTKQEIHLLKKLVQDMKPKYPEYFV